jgi:TrmH family RNA methyltransferase
MKRRSSREPELALLEGTRLVQDAIGAGLELIEVAASSRPDPERDALLALLEHGGARVHRVEPELLQSISELETGPGLVAIARRPRLREAASFGPGALVLVAAGVQNPGNLGALLRTAEAAGATAALVGPGCADPFGWKSLRGAMGSAFRLPLARFDELPPLIERVREAGLRLIASEPAGGTPWDGIDYRGAIALAVGGEGGGLPAALLEAAAQRVHIPMPPAVDSLNVAVAAGVLFFEAARQRRLDFRKRPAQAPAPDRRFGSPGPSGPANGSSPD